eukprot:gene1064-1152_t
MNLTEEYKKINPFQTLPTIDDNGFLLNESHAILTYLARKFNVEDPYYPKNIQNRALVDQYLHWHHQNTRTCTKLLQLANKDNLHYQVFYNKEAEEAHVRKTLFKISEHFLGDKPYLCSRDHMTIADISASFEIYGLNMIDYDFSDFPKVVKWLNHMMSFKEMKESNETYEKLVNIAKSRRIQS